MKKHIIFLFLFSLAASACSLGEYGSLPDTGVPVQFSVCVGQYAVKAGDTAFEEGDEIGISALSPIDASNVKYVWRGGSLVPADPEQAICWAPGQKTASLFFAYYPYREDFRMTTEGFADDPESPWSMLVEVEPDQSTDEGFSRSHALRTSTGRGWKPGENVMLQFTHSVAKANIVVDNRLDDPVRDVYLSGVFGRTFIFDKVRLDGTQGSIKAHAVGDGCWQLFLIPQNIAPTLTLVTASGKEYPFAAPNVVSFSRGNIVTLSVTLDESVQADIVAEIADWSEDKEYVFDNETYQRKKRAEAVCGSYLVTGKSYWYEDPKQWVMTLSLEGNRVRINNFAGASNRMDMDIFGTLDRDALVLTVPIGQTTEYTYSSGWPFYYYSISTEMEYVGSGDWVIEVLRNEQGEVTGLAYPPDLGIWLLTYDSEGMNANYEIIVPATLSAVKQ